jgi:hypothetical protein
MAKQFLGASGESRRRDIKEDLRALIAEGRRFATILVDPPWTFRTYSAKGEGRSPKCRRMTLAEIKALPIADSRWEKLHHSFVGQLGQCCPRRLTPRRMVGEFNARRIRRTSSTAA